MGDVYMPNPKAWVLDGENIRDGGGQMVACCCYPRTSTEGKANAAILLRSAQSNADLLALCAELVDDIDGRADPSYLMPGTANIVERIREVIAKAKQ